VQGLGLVPDVPHATNVSVRKTEGSGVGFITEPPVKGLDRGLGRGAVRGNHASSVSSRQCLSVIVEGREVLWDTLLIGKTLFIEVPSNMLLEGSRASFVSLLELAEEKLCCSKVVVCFKKSHRDKAKLIQAFKFMGFEQAAVTAAGAHHSTASDVIYLSYCVDSSDSSEPSSDDDDSADMSE